MYSLAGHFDIKNKFRAESVNYGNTYQFYFFVELMKKIIIIIFAVILFLMVFFAVSWICYWEVVIGLPNDNPYGMLWLDKSNYLVLRETAEKSWLCVEEEFNQFGILIDDSHIRDVYWNDSIIYAMSVKGFMKKDSTYYVYNIKQDKLIDTFSSKKQFLQRIQTMNVNLSEIGHLHIPSE